MSTVLSPRALSNPVRPVCGEFGKALPGSMSLNFCTAGGKHCDRRCPHHPDSTAPNADRACYAAANEKRPDRTELLAKLERHENTEPADILRKACDEVGKRIGSAKPIPWFRFSTDGSLPHNGAAIADELRALVALLRSTGTPIHIPVETAEKARTYRGILGSTATVRQSCHSSAEFLTADGPVSVVAGTMRDKPRKRVAIAKALAKARETATGRKARVCPAVAAQHLRTGSKAAKCGNCTLCDRADRDIVYPIHR